MPGRVIRRPMFRGRVEPRNPMGILASSPQLAGAVNRAHGGFNNPHPPVKYAQAGFFNQAQAGTPGMSLSRAGSVRPGQSVGVGVDIDQIVRDAQKKAATPSFTLPGAIGVVGQPPVKSGPVGAPANGIMGVFSQGESPEIKEGMGIGTGNPIPAITKKQADALLDEGIINASLTTPSDKMDDGGDDAKDGGKKMSVSEGLAQILDSTQVESELQGLAENTGKSQKKIVQDKKTKLEDIQGRAEEANQKLLGTIDAAADIQQRAATSFEDIKTRLEEGFSSPKDAVENVKLSDVYDATVKELGYDAKNLDEAYKDERTQSFWINLMKAGLAIAAGESPNALTNVAKGLMFGMESWGKDMKDLNKLEREDRKEFRNALRQNLKSEKDMAITLATAENGLKSQLASFELQTAQAQSAAELALVNAEQQKAAAVFTNLNMEVALQNSITDSEIKIADLEQQSAEAKANAFVKIYELGITKFKTQASLMTDDVKQVSVLGADYMYMTEDGSLEMTEKGLATMMQIAMDATNFKATFPSLSAYSQAITSTKGKLPEIIESYQDHLARQGTPMEYQDIDPARAIEYHYNLNKSVFVAAGGQVEPGLVPIPPDNIPGSVYNQLRNSLQPGQRDTDKNTGRTFERSADGTQIFEVK